MKELPKKSTKREVGEAAVEGVASAIPVAGGPLAVALAFWMNWGLTKRRDEWLGELAAAVEELEARTDGLSFEELIENDRFVDAVVQATTAAQATTQSEKLDALRNGVLNTLTPEAPTYDEQARFLRLVDELTPAHLTVLTILHDPRAAVEARQETEWHAAGTVSRLLERLVPAFVGKREWSDLLVSDLDDARLSSVANALHAMITPEGLLTSRTTPLGDRFLKFIAPPD